MKKSSHSPRKATKTSAAKKSIEKLYKKKKKVFDYAYNPTQWVSICLGKSVQKKHNLKFL